MYYYIKKQLEDAGELMIQTSDGRKFELHLHNTIFDDSSELIKIETGTETYWIKGSDPIYMWIHREA